MTRPSADEPELFDQFYARLLRALEPQHQKRAWQQQQQHEIEIMSLSQRLGEDSSVGAVTDSLATGASFNGSTGTGTGDRAAHAQHARHAQHAAPGSPAAAHKVPAAWNSPPRHPRHPPPGSQSPRQLLRSTLNSSTVGQHEYGDADAGADSRHRLRAHHTLVTHHAGAPTDAAAAAADDQKQHRLETELDALDAARSIGDGKGQHVHTQHAAAPGALRAQMQHDAREMDRLKALVQQLIQQQAPTQQILRELVEEHKQLQQSYAGAVAKAEALEREADAQEDDAERAAQELEQARADCAKQADQVSALKKRCEKLERDVRITRENEASASNQKDNVLRKLEKLEDKRRDLEVQNLDFKDERAQLRAEIARLNKALDRMRWPAGTIPPGGMGAGTVDSSQASHTPQPPHAQPPSTTTSSRFSYVGRPFGRTRVVLCGEAEVWGRTVPRLAQSGSAPGMALPATCR